MKLVPATSFAEHPGAPLGGVETVSVVLVRARTLQNVTLCSRVSRKGMQDIYGRASCLCCTSRVEGFPNTFLEAWSHGLPVVSMFDPDALIEERGLGATAHDVPGLTTAVRELLASPERWRQASDNARRYYVENHTVESVLPRLSRFFLNVQATAYPATVAQVCNLCVPPVENRCHRS